VEFPKYFKFAQSFPTLIPYSEGFGFLADLTRPNSVDYVWNVTAHEVAHQWWAHQVIGANVQGATVLSEALAEYSALMVMERRYGPHKMRRYLKYELDTYLTARGGTARERPLALVESYQTFIHYQKGALAMYAIKDAIGEDAVNRALADLVRLYAYKSDPYPVSLDLLELLRRQAGPEHQQLMTDLLQKIVFWDTRIARSEAVEVQDGKWRVTIEVNARKLESNERGEEKEAPLDQAIDVGLFSTDPAASAFDASDVILLEKRRLKSGTQTLEFIVDRKPAFVGVDPYIKLITRGARNNVVSLGSRSQGS
jgi:aminopeptidase N